MQVHCQLKMLKRDAPLKFNCQLSTLPKNGEIIHIHALETYFSRDEQRTLWKSSFDSDDSLDVLAFVVQVMHLCPNSQRWDEENKSVAKKAIAVLYLEEREGKKLPEWAL